MLMSLLRDWNLDWSS